MAGRLIGVSASGSDTAEGYLAGPCTWLIAEVTAEMIEELVARYLFRDGFLECGTTVNLSMRILGIMDDVV